MIMLQIGGIFYNVTIKFVPRLIWRMSLLQASTVNSLVLEASTVSKVAKSQTVPLDNEKGKKKQREVLSTATLIQSVFDSVKEKSNDLQYQINNYLVDSAIHSATSVDELLDRQKSRISYKEAFAIVSVLANWVNVGKAQLSDFQSDERFIQLCKLITRKTQAIKILEAQSDKKRTDETCLKNLLFLSGLQEIKDTVKDVSSMSVQQMISVMSALAQKRKRTEPLLKSLASGISSNEGTLDIKQSSDLLYNMAVLNFPNQGLLKKTCSHLLETIPTCEKSSVIGSIATSLGLLRYKDEAVLNALSEWFVTHSAELRPQDRFAFLLTLATVGYNPENASTLFEKLIELLRVEDVLSHFDWLNLVWCSVILNRATHQQISSVLNSTFITRLSAVQKLEISTKLKLLNINAAANFLVKDYKGEVLPDDSPIFDLRLTRSKEKQVIVNSVVQTLKNVFPSSNYINTDIDSRMGFLIDAECLVDKQCNPLSINKQVEENKSVIRIAFLVCYYHDLCRGKNDPLGIFNMSHELLKAKGYKVSIISYNEFRSLLTLLDRVKYLNGIIKSIVQESST